MDRMLAIICHFMGLFGFFLIIFLPNVIGPLVMWLLFRKSPKCPLTREHSKEVLNFQISMSIYSLITFIIFSSGQIVEYLYPNMDKQGPILDFLNGPIFMFFPGFFILSFLIFNFCFSFNGFRYLNDMRNDGNYRYPLNLRLIK